MQTNSKLQSIVTLMGLAIGDRYWPRNSFLEMAFRQLWSRDNTQTGNCPDSLVLHQATICPVYQEPTSKRATPYSPQDLTSTAQKL